MNLLSRSLQVHNCPRVLLALTWHADLAPQSTSWLKHFIKRHQRHHLHHLLASGLRDLHGGVHGQGTVVASSAAPTPSLSACAMRIPSTMPPHANRVAWSVSAGPSAMSPSLSTGVRHHAGPSQARRCRRQPRIARMPRGRGEQPRRCRRRRRRCWHSLTHTQHPLACRWRKKMRGRRTQEEHTKWSCLIFELQLLSPFIDTSSQCEHLQGKAL